MSDPQDELLTRLMGALREVLTRAAEPEAVLSAILRQAVALTGATRGVFVDVGPGGELAFSVLHAYRADALADTGHYSRAVFARCLASGEDLILRDAVGEMPVSTGASVVMYRMAAVLCMPLRAGGRVAALLHLEHGTAGYFDDSHRRLLRPLLGLAAPVLETLAAGRAVLQERDRLAESEQRLRAEAEEQRREFAREWSFGRFVGRAPAVRSLEQHIRRAAASPSPLLLEGETGTGKSLLARIVHASGPRAQQPFITVFCPSLERSMMEAELFGHRRGAFTGAIGDRVGKVPAAEHGTLFLDEVGDLPLELQPKLLRLLQERAYERIGDPHERLADVRVIAATSRDLEREVREGRFRRDLFERLRFLPVRVPPLRERREDLPAILRHCLDLAEPGRWIELTPAAERWLVELDAAWPGNVRHLEQLAARLVAEAPTTPVDEEVLARLLADEARDPDARGDAATPVSASAPPPPGDAPPLDLDAGLAGMHEVAERAWLAAALRRHPDLTRAELAARLRISESTLFKKLRQHGLGG